MSIERVVELLEQYQDEAPQKIIEAVKAMHEKFLADRNALLNPKQRGAPAAAWWDGRVLKLNEVIEFYESLLKFLPGFLEYRQKPENAVKAITEQLTVFFEEKNQHLSSALSYALHLKRQLVREKKPIGLVALAQSLFYEPNQFVGFLYYLLHENVPVREIMDSHVVHRFLQYNGFDADCPPIQQAFQMLKELSKTDYHVKSLLMMIERSGFMARPDYLITIVSDQSGALKFKGKTVAKYRCNYEFPLFRCEPNADHYVALYVNFGMDFIRALNFTLPNVNDNFTALFRALIQSSSRSFFLQELPNFLLNELNYERAKNLFLLSFAVVNSVAGADISFLLQSNRDFIYSALMVSVRDCAQWNDNQLTELAHELSSNLCRKKMPLSITELYLAVEFLAICPDSDYRHCILNTVFESIKKIAISNNLEGENDAANYGVPLDLFDKIQQLRGSVKRADLIVGKLNASIYRKILQGASFSDIKAEWKLPVLNALKKFFGPAPCAKYLMSVNALKVTVLHEMWRLRLEKKAVFSFDSFFDRVIEKDNSTVEEQRAEKMRILLETLLDINTESALHDTLMTYLNENFSVGCWVQKIINEPSHCNYLLLGRDVEFLQKLPLRPQDYLTLFYRAVRLLPQGAITAYAFNHIVLSSLSDLDYAKLFFVILPTGQTQYQRTLCSALNVDHACMAALLADNGDAIRNMKALQNNHLAVRVLLRVASEQGAQRIVNYLCLITSDYDSITFAFRKFFTGGDKIGVQLLLQTVLDKQCRKQNALFNTGISWWNGREADNFYVACAIGMIRRSYKGSRQKAFQKFALLIAPSVGTIEEFLMHSSSFEKSSRLNRALTELVEQMQGKKAVSMTAVLSSLITDKSENKPEKTRVFC